MAQNLFLILILGYGCYFFSDLLIRKYSIAENSFIFILKRSIFTSFIALIWLIYSNTIFKTPNLLSIIQIAGFSLICGFGLFFFIKANKTLPFPNIITINLFGLILQELIAHFYLKEALIPDFLIAFSISISGLILMASIPKSRVGFYFSILSTCFWSIGYSFLSIPLKSNSIEWVTFIMELTILFLSALFLTFNSSINFKKFNFKQLKTSRSLVYPIIALATIFGSLMMNYAYQKFKVSEISFFYITLYPLAILFSRLYFKERLTKIDWLSNTLVIAGIFFYLIY